MLPDEYNHAYIHTYNHAYMYAILHVDRSEAGARGIEDSRAGRDARENHSSTAQDNPSPPIAPHCHLKPSMAHRTASTHPPSPAYCR